MPFRRSLRYFGLLAAVAVWLGAIVGAPLWAAQGGPAGWLYLPFHLICHQEADRSFQLSGFPLAVCHRCLGIYLGFFAGLLLWPVWTQGARWLMQRPRLLGICLALMLVNVLLPNYSVDRFLTGFLVGLPSALFTWLGVEELFRPGPAHDRGVANESQ